MHIEREILPCGNMVNQTSKIVLSLLVFLFLGILFSCETSELSPGDSPTGQEYFPIQVGNFWVYRVDTTQYTFAGEVKKGSYFLKEVISDSLPDQEGSKVFRIEIYKTLDTTKAWEIDSVWVVRVGNDKIIRTENNRPFVKLLFPLREGSRWDGNQYNTNQDSNSVFWYTLRNLGVYRRFQNQEIETVEVVQKIDSNCVNNSYYSEVYYKNIGLGFRRKSFLEYDSCTQAIPDIEQGKTVDYNLISYGKQ
jgi:hypothetical protein